MNEYGQPKRNTAGENEDQFAARLAALHEAILGGASGSGDAPSPSGQAAADSYSVDHPLADLLALIDEARDDITGNPASRENHLRRDLRDGDSSHNRDAAVTDSPGDRETPLALGDATEPVPLSIANAIPKRADGFQLGRFEIETALGRGGFGLVYAARDRQLERRVAIKIPRPEALLSPSLRERFLREGRAAASLSHPNIVTVYEANQEGPLCYLAAELIEGDNLSEWCATHSPDAQQSARLLIALCDAIQHAHSRGILHRDLKPGNVLMQNASPKVTDFGLALRLEDQGSALADDTVVGTPAYMSPEQSRGNTEVVDHRTDIYGLGAVLYFLLTGRAPFTGETPHQILDQLRAKSPVPPRQLRDSVPLDLQAICLKCLNKSADDRYASAHDLGADLQRFLNSEPVMARPVGASTRLVRWMRRNPALASTAGLALVFLVLGLMAAMIGWWTTAQSLDRERVAKHQAEVASQESRRLYQQAKQMVDRYFTEVASNQLLGIPGMTPLRQELLELASDYYQQFLNDNAGDRELQRELADAHAHLGEIAQLRGRPTDALEHYQRVLTLLEPLLSPGDGPAGEYDADTPMVQVEYADALCQMAGQQMALGELDKAATSIASAIALMESELQRSPAHEDVQAMLAQALGTGGRVALEKQAIDVAEARLRRAMVLGTELLEADPEDRERHSQLNGYRFLLAVLLKTQGDLSEAETLAVENVATARRIADRPDADVFDRKKLADTLHSRALYQMMRREFQATVPVLREAVAILTELTQRFPNAPAYQGSLAHTAATLAIAEAENGDLQAAIDQFVVAEQSQAEMVRLDPESSEAQIQLAGVKLNFAAILAQRTSLLVEASDRLQTALEIFQQVQRESPDSRTAVDGIVGSLVNLAGIAESTGQHQRALDFADQALEVVENALPVQPQDPQWNHMRQMTLANRAAALDGLGRYAEAADAWATFLDGAPPPQVAETRIRLAAALVGADRIADALELVDPVPVPENRNARIGLFRGFYLARLGTAVEQDPGEAAAIVRDAILTGALKLPEAVEPNIDDPNLWDDMALACFDQAARAGHFGLAFQREALQDHPDLQRLANRPEFIEFMTELETNANPNPVAMDEVVNDDQAD